MANLTLENFWKKRLSLRAESSGTLVRGWTIERKGIEGFQEAPLTVSTELSEASDAQTSPILLVSAPGAVGKSTLAKQIAFETGAVYVDLAKADPVGGNTLSGGLVKSGLFEGWSNQNVALLIDGLDEARLRVTQEAFEAFLSDLLDISKNRTSPTVLFGRTGAVQESWLLLDNPESRVAVLEIGYYGIEEAIKFADARLNIGKSVRPHHAAEQKAIRLLLSRLRDQTETDGARFSGYAPVLQAVAERVAREQNPAAFIAQIEAGERPITLRTVVESILDREREKLKPLAFQDTSLVERLYSRDEQLVRLSAKIFEVSQPSLPSMGAQDARTYDTALKTWVDEHPFLDGKGKPSSVVFDAVILAKALNQPSTAESALARELARGAAANPFLAEFYFPSESETSAALPSEHIGVLYSSIRARLSLGDSASLFVEGNEDAENEESLEADVEINLVRRGSDLVQTMKFVTEQVGSLRLGSHVEDVEISVPHTTVEIGPGAELIFVPPVSIVCDRLTMTGGKIVVEQGRDVQGAVALEARNYEGASITTVPTIRGATTLTASWPGVSAHPWTNFATDPTQIEDPRLQEAFRRLRRFVIAFRSHSKGQLARYRYKIEHARMTKESGQAVLDQLMKENIISLDGSMYFLDANKLGAVVGISYADAMSRQYGQQAIDFIKRALAIN